MWLKRGCCSQSTSRGKTCVGTHTVSRQRVGGTGCTGAGHGVRGQCPQGGACRRHRATRRATTPTTRVSPRSGAGSLTLRGLSATCQSTARRWGPPRCASRTARWQGSSGDDHDDTKKNTTQMKKQQRCCAKKRTGGGNKQSLGTRGARPGRTGSTGPGRRRSQRGLGQTWCGGV